MAFLKPLNNLVEVKSAEETPELPDPYLLWNVQYDLQPAGAGIYYYDGTSLQKLANQADIARMDTWWSINGIELFYLWNDTQTVADPGAGNLSGNNVQLGAVTIFSISKTTALGQEIAATNVQVGDEILVSDRVKAALEQFSVTGVTIHSTWIEMGVSQIQGNNTNPAVGDFMSLRYIPPGII